MKITREIYALIPNDGFMKFAGREGQSWRTNLAEIIPELDNIRGQFKVTVTLEVPRVPGWYWAIQTKNESIKPYYWNGQNWWMFARPNCHDEDFAHINETRIPEPTDG